MITVMTKEIPDAWEFFLKDAVSVYGKRRTWADLYPLMDELYELSAVLTSDGTQLRFKNDSLYTAFLLKYSNR